MGASHARMLVGEGAKVVIGDILDDAGKALAEESSARPPATSTSTSRSPSSGKLRFPPRSTNSASLNVLVNNAGIVALGQLRKFDLAKWQKVMDVNLTGTFLGMRASIDAMTAAGGGSIINVSSIEGLRGAPMVHPYVASKWAVRGLSKSAALELAPHKIRVNSIHPGLHPYADDQAPSRRHGHHPARTPRPSPSEVSTFVVFLASDESRYATGAEFVMDGGLVTDVPTRSVRSSTRVTCPKRQNECRRHSAAEASPRIDRERAISIVGRRNTILGSSSRCCYCFARQTFRMSRGPRRTPQTSRVGARMDTRIRARSLRGRRDAVPAGYQDSGWHSDPADAGDCPAGPPRGRRLSRPLRRHESARQGPARPVRAGLVVPHDLHGARGPHDVSLWSSPASTTAPRSG